jgi:HAD superfamily hydrolase (TIGR01549 family)
MKKVIFWDFDGTLVHSKHLWSNAIYDTLLNYIPDTSITFSQIRALTFDLYPWDTPDEDFTHLTGEQWWNHMEQRFCEKYLEVGVPADIARKAGTEIRDKILQKEKYHLYEDTLSTLVSCENLGYKNYILSNNYPELPQMIHQLKLSPYFDGIIVSGLVGYDKPRKEIFQIALERAGFPDICYMVGDNPKADIKGALDMKIPAVLVHHQAVCGADYYAESLQEVLSFLSR